MIFLNNVFYLMLFFDIKCDLLQLWYDNIFLRKWVCNCDNRINYSNRQIDGRSSGGWSLIGHSLCLQISWIRKRDLHILTSSTLAYTGDARFSVKHPESSDEWTLRIEYVQPRDAGVYECQVNTEPKMNLAFMLKVEGKIKVVKSLEV